MALPSTYTVAPKRIPDLFAQVRDGQAPERVTQQLLKDWGFSSSNDRALIPLMKALGFLSPDGKPTTRYHDYRDHSRSPVVMAEALRESYSDIFLIKENPTEADKKAIEGKFKSFHNVSDKVARLMMRNFYQLLTLADLSNKKTRKKPDKKADEKLHTEAPPGERRAEVGLAELHYNIQIHLPATKDVEVYNAIFKSLREHLVEE